MEEPRVAARAMPSTREARHKLLARTLVEEPWVRQARQTVLKVAGPHPITAVILAPQPPGRVLGRQS